MRIGVAGKTGSGKTTVTALLAMGSAARGLRALAVDTDVSPNLGISLGLDQEALEEVRTVSRALVNGRGGGSITTAQLVAGYGIATPAGVTLLHAMPASDAVGGCCCPAHASGASLLASALRDEADITLLDIEAGLDHLARSSGTVAHTDVLVVVMEPSLKSSVTAARIIATAKANGIDRVVLVGNKADAQEGDDSAFIDAAAQQRVPLAGVLPYSVAVQDADRAGTGLDLTEGLLRTAVDAVVDTLLAE